MTITSKILVTGATGYLGSRLSKRLVEAGYSVRALVRGRSSSAALIELGVDIAIGDLGDGPSIAEAVRGVEVVVHAAAGTSGTAQDSETATVLGTRHVLEACRANRIRKLIYISTCSVYEVVGYAENQLVTEDAQLERRPLLRGHYSAAKLRAEALVTAARDQGGVAAVVLRPGTIYGPGAEVFTNMMGVSLARKIYLVFGSGESELPLVHVENVVDAIIECVSNSAADKQTFNVVDQDPVAKKTYMDLVIKPRCPGAMVIYIPMPLLVALTWVQEKLLLLLGRRPFLTVYRLMSSQKRVRYSTSRIERAIGWRSHIRFQQGAEQLVRGLGQTTPTS